MDNIPSPKGGGKRGHAHSAITGQSAWAAASDDLARWTWKYVVNRKDVYGRYLPLHERNPKNDAVTHKGMLTLRTLGKHYCGEDHGYLLGLHTTSPDNTCRWVLIDIDHHGERDPDRLKANRKAAVCIYDKLRQLGFAPLLTSSNGIGGYHLLVIFKTPIPSTTAYAFARWVTRDWQALGLTERPESFPKQAKLAGKTSYGSWVRLPGRHHTRPWYSKVWIDDHWASGAEAIQAILSTRGADPSLIPIETQRYTEEESSNKEIKGKARAGVGTASRAHRSRSSKQPTPTEKILTRLNNVRPSGSGWSARCPAHNDHSNSLSIAEGDDGRVLLYCHASCEVEDIVEALQMSMMQLFAGGKRRRPLRHPRKEG